MPNKYRPFDTRLQHRAPASAAVTATAVVGTINQLAAGRTEYSTIIYVEAIDIVGSDELYTWVIEVSDDAFSTVNETVAIRDMGDTAVRQSGTPDTVAGTRMEILWSTEALGTAYKHWRLKLFHAGATSSITFHAYSTILE